MELNREEDARFLVHHQVTEKKLLHLEKGVRKLGFQSGGNRILAGLLMASVMGLAVGLVFDGMVARTFFGHCRSAVSDLCCRCVFHL